MKLDGQWEFCRDRLRGPSDFLKSEKREDCGFIAVPGFWKDRGSGGAVFSGRGRATYHLTILNGPERQPVTITTQRLYSDFRLWINGVLADQRLTGGGVPKSRKDYIFVHNNRVSSFTLQGGANEVVLQLMNERYESGGIGSSIQLEDRGRAERNRMLRYTASMVIVGLLLALAMYNIVMYVFTREEAAPLIIGLFGLFFAINLFNVQLPIFPDALSRCGKPFLIDYVSIILVMVLAMMAIRSLYPADFALPVVRLYQVATAGFMGIQFFVDFLAFQQLIKVYYLLNAILWCYTVYVFIRAIRHRRDDAILFFLSYIPLYLAGINDILYELWIVDTGKMAPFSMIVLCVSATLVISRRYSIALRTVKEQSRDLEEMNVSLKKLDRLKDQFLAAASHELRTPLHGMIGLLEAMMEGTAGTLVPKAQETISLVASSGHRLANMVNDLLDMATIQDGGISLNLRPVDLRSLGDAVVKLSIPLAAGKPLTIVNAVGGDMPRVRADEDRLRQVLYNLVGNAIKFTARGTVELSARIVPDADGERGSMAEVRVSDTGIGVPEEFRETIFQAYRQADEGDTRSYPGTGLGLAIARQIVTLHGGTIGVTPGVEGGSVFYFTLPLWEGMLPEGQDDVVVESMLIEPPPVMSAGPFLPRAEAAGMGFDGTPVILVVDDDPVNVKIIRDYFESKRCEVKTAADGIGALEILERGASVDLVLLDIMMPAMSGYEVCRRIRAARTPEELPVIMLTAKNMMADIDAAFEAGANDYVVKPFRLSELHARVTTMLKLRTIQKLPASGITIRTRSGVHSLAFEEIIYITSHAKSIVIHTNRRDIDIPVLMKVINDRLPPDIFVRIHKSHIINIRYMTNIYHAQSGRYRVRLSDEDDTELPVGTMFLESLRKKL
ncbi:MAG: response regulator [Spirochaetes bacterium]|nr:response regulator [Spirochaetota bacterium]